MDRRNVGCLAAALLAAGALLIGFGALLGLDLESKPGLRDDRTGLALVFLVPGALAAVAAPVVARYGGTRRARVPVTAVAALLLALAGWWVVERAPLLACDSGVSLDDDGVRRCAGTDADDRVGAAHRPSYVSRSGTAVKPTPYAETERP
ncbi:hypothetical protein ACIQBJ_22315 [Kitasatospora sp. NPDC088391]|uniref:hypothetical protein n=1 Tax=Kitasatospora sp. NPDC088391 TaxID=3364074 RepID=UPI0038209926